MICYIVQSFIACMVSEFQVNNLSRYIELYITCDPNAKVFSLKV